MRFRKRALFLFTVGFLLVAIALVLYAYLSTMNRTLIRFDIEQDKEVIYLSTYSEPPQFAIWLEDPETGISEEVFVTGRAGKGDWEGKADVPVALPRWSQLFRNPENEEQNRPAEKGGIDAVTGATPKEDLFSINAEVKPGSRWICWIEVNLAGDYNSAFRELDERTLTYDEFSCGQPALLYRAEIEATEGMEANPQLVLQSRWNDGTVHLEPVSLGVTTARDIFRSISVSIQKPKPKLIEKRRI